jgi:thiosulfate/3-mercaptopyruvate sulfurtransferase
MMKSLDVRITDTIVCYDKIGMLSAPRAFWMFKTFGATNVYILNGTFSKWKKENRPTESGDNRAAWH